MTLSIDQVKRSHLLIPTFGILRVHEDELLDYKQEEHSYEAAVAACWEYGLPYSRGFITRVVERSAHETPLLVNPKDFGVVPKEDWPVEWSPTKAWRSEPQYDYHEARCLMPPQLRQWMSHWMVVPTRRFEECFFDELKARQFAMEIGEHVNPEVLCIVLRLVEHYCIRDGKDERQGEKIEYTG